MTASDPRHLYLLRHAEAVPGGLDMDDFDRPLSPRGRRQAAYVAERLANVPIEYVLCSSATRTRQTVNPVLHARAAALPTVVYDRRVYGADARALIALILAMPAATRCALVVGHNPAMEELLEVLAPTGGALPGGFPKGACVHLTTTADWAALTSQAMRFGAFDRGETEDGAAR